MKIVVGVIVMIALASVRADACGVQNFSGLARAVAEALDAKPDEVESPVVEAGAGATVDGTVGSIALGYAWGHRDHGIFDGSEVSRVMLGLRAGDTRGAVSLTYGWYENQFMSAGLDVGAEMTKSGLGPTTRLTLGTHALAVRITGGVTFEPAPHLVASAELVIEVADMIGTL